MSKSNSLRYDLRAALLPHIKNNNTKRTYKRAIDDFSEWGKENGVKKLCDVSVSVLQAYTDDLMHSVKNYTPATIHAKLAPICKAAGVPMENIRKPKRTADKITRSRKADANAQGKAQLADPKYARCIELQKAVGIRRAELGRLTIGDWDGTWLTVRHGKGGKTTRQWILPDDRATVDRIVRTAVFRNRFKTEHGKTLVLNASEIPDKADLHSLRAEHAQKCYDFFQNFIAAGHGETLREDLCKTFYAANEKLRVSNLAAYRAREQKFLSSLTGTYILRGANKQKAVSLGLPTEYDKLALMCVSVWELSHWRLDVTVVNYMIR